MSNDPSASRSLAEPGDLAVVLRTNVTEAEAVVAAMEQEYETVLADPGVIQEDRDGTRRLLEESRTSRDAARGALERFTTGTYGRCATCGQAISAERLDALPNAETCVGCSR